MSAALYGGRARSATDQPALPTQQSIPPWFLNIQYLKKYPANICRALPRMGSLGSRSIELRSCLFPTSAVTREERPLSATSFSTCWYLACDVSSLAPQPSCWGLGGNPPTGTFRLPSLTCVHQPWQGGQFAVMSSLRDHGSPPPPHSPSAMPNTQTPCLPTSFPS